MLKAHGFLQRNIGARTCAPAHAYAHAPTHTNIHTHTHTHTHTCTGTLYELFTRTCVL